MKHKVIKKAISVLLSAVILAMSVSASGISADDSTNSVQKSRVSVHDPSILKAKDGKYYVYGSHVDAAKSDDLQNWTTFTNGYATTENVIFGDLYENLKKVFDWTGASVVDNLGLWAPDVIYNEDYINTDGSKGAYLIYFCAHSSSGAVIAYASSQDPEGPFEFVDTLIYSSFTESDNYVTDESSDIGEMTINTCYTSTNVDELIKSGEVEYNEDWFNLKGKYKSTVYPMAIDPTVYTASDGKMYMCYGSQFGGIYTIELDPETGKCIHPTSGTTEDGRIIDSYFGTKIAAGKTAAVEGSYIEYNSDTEYYYLWVSYGGLWNSGGYNMRVFRSENPDGPFYDPAGYDAASDSSNYNSNSGLKVMSNYGFSCLDKAYVSCGHNSVLHDDNGKWYLIYHARFDEGTGSAYYVGYHELRVHEMYFNEEGWPVVTPFEYSGDEISETGYEESSIVGSYEYINHGKEKGNYSTIINYSTIELNADGTITGDVTGTWEQSKYDSSVTLTIDGEKYYGYFIAAKDEKGIKVMSFTAVGENNITVWGTQTVECKDNIERENVPQRANIQINLKIPNLIGENIGKLNITDVNTQRKIVPTQSSDEIYVVSSLSEGKYELELKADGCVSRTVEVSANDNQSTVVTITLNMIGDINGDGRLTTADVGLANSHAKGVKALVDYQLECADVTFDGKVTTADVGRINARAKGTQASW